MESYEWECKETGKEKWNVTGDICFLVLQKL